VNLLEKEEAHSSEHRFLFTKQKKYPCLQKTQQRIKNPIFTLLYPDHRSGQIWKYTCL